MAVKQEHTPSFIGSLQEEVAAEASPMLRFLINNARLVALGVALFVIAIAGYWLYDSRQTRLRDELRLEFGRLVTLKKGQERLNALEEYLKTSPTALRSAAWFALAETAQELQEYPKAYTAWAQIAQLDPSMRVTATLAMAEALIGQQKRQEALELLDSITVGLSEFDAANVNERIVFLAEALGKYDRAIVACEILSAELSPANSADFWAQKAAALQKLATDQAARAKPE